MLANSGDPDQMPQKMLCSAGSDQGLHCLPVGFYAKVHLLSLVTRKPVFWVCDQSAQLQKLATVWKVWI